MQPYAGSADLARQADAAAIDYLGFPSLLLMEHAAIGIAKTVLEDPLFQNSSAPRIAVVCGPGNNGADGIAAARLLKAQNITCELFITESTSAQQAVQLKMARSLGIPIAPLAGFLKAGSFDLIIDALLGSGLSRPADGLIAACIQKINSEPAHIYSVDIPSGLDGTTGTVGSAAVMAEHTISLALYKTGFFLAQGPAHCGQIHLIDIGIPDFVFEKLGAWPLITQKRAAAALPEISLFSNKKNQGRILYCAGSAQMQGALALAAKSCLQAGCGTLTLFTPEKSAAALRDKLDLAMTIGAKEDELGFFDAQAAPSLCAILDRYDQIGAGNGMGTGEGAGRIIETLLASDKPLVLDADGINLLAAHPQWIDRVAPLILTPHVLEFSRLAKKDKDEVLADPFTLALAWAKEHPNAVLVLKSWFTLIVQGNRKAMLAHPNGALAKGGSGDVLAGLCTAMAASHPDPFEAALCAVYVHNAAASEDLSPLSFTPEDLIRRYGQVFADLQKEKAVHARSDTPFIQPW